MSLNPKIFYKGWLHTEHDPEGPPPDTGRRWRVLKLVIVLAFLILTARLWQLQVLQNDRYYRAEVANSVRRLPLEPQRGVLYDRNGVQLTTNTPLWQVSLTPADMPEDEAEYTAAMARLEDRLKLGGVVYVDAGQMPDDGRDELTARIARAIGAQPEEVQAAIARSEETEAALLLREELPLDRLPGLREALKDLPGVDAVPKLQWLVEYSGVSPFQPLVVAENVPRETALAIEGERLLVPGVSIGQAAARAYPDGPLYSAVIGYVGKIAAEQVRPLQAQARRLKQRPYALDETVGKAGLERELEGYLRGRPGSQEVEVTSTNRVVRQGKVTDARPGHNVTLTLDAKVQKTATDSLSSALRRSGAKAGAMVALDPRNGNVLGLVSLPSYDNNLFIGGISQREYGALQSDPGTPLLNKAISGAYTPGSVLKPFIAAGGLAERVIDRRVKYECKGSIEVPSGIGTGDRELFKSSNPRDLGPQSVIEALANDCDPYFYIMSGPEQLDASGRPLRYYQPGAEDPTPFRGLGVERIVRHLRGFGFGAPTGIDLAGESGGLVADPKWKRQRFPGQAWTLGDTLRTGVGQGYTLVTPMQVATATGAIANGGTRYRPQLVLKVTSAEGKDVLVPQPKPAGTVGMTPDHLATVREGMLRSVEDGTAATLSKQGRLPEGIEVAAMAGALPEASDSKRAGARWFSAFAPYERPELVVAVLLDGADGRESYASQVGADVLSAYFGKEK